MLHKVLREATLAARLIVRLYLAVRPVRCLGCVNYRPLRSIEYARSSIGLLLGQGRTQAVCHDCIGLTRPRCGPALTSAP